MTDSGSAYRARMTVAPDNSSVMAETPFGFFLLAAERDRLPDDITLDVVHMSGRIVGSLSFPEVASPCIATLHFAPPQGDVPRETYDGEGE